MKKLLKKFSALSLLILISCSVYNGSTYKGHYKGETVIISFENSKEGYISIGKNDSIPFTYRIDRQKVNSNGTKINTYIYRFTVDAKYDFNFPFGLYEIGQKRGAVLRANDSLTFVRK